MLYRLAKIFLLGCMFSGLCLPAQAITTTNDPIVRSGLDTVADAPHLSVTIAQAGTPPATVPPAALGNVLPVRIALLLPLRSDNFGHAARAVRAGFLAAYEHEKDGMDVTVIETDDQPQNVLSAYDAAVQQYDMVVGPLSRTDVTAIVQSGMASKPTIALTQPDAQGDAGLELPRQMLVMGLSIEDEARQLANWAATGKAAGKALVISTNAAWQRRAAKAFAQQWQRLGLALESIEAEAFSGYLNAKSLAQLKKRMQDEKPALLFVALDAEQARQLRAVAGNDIRLYGTSQLNPFILSERDVAERMSDMDGARLLDIPWQLQVDHPAVMVYPRPTVNPDQKRSADLERLYALGIDAYRVAREIAAHHSNFEIDGVTGKLTIGFGKGASYFDRIEQPAVYQGGVVVPLMGKP